MSDFKERGLELAEELRRLSKNYHVKSDEHDILEYEAACVEARVEFASTGTEIPENLLESPLLGQWSSRLRAAMPAVFAQVERFYEEFSRVLAPNNSLQARRP